MEKDKTNRENMGSADRFHKSRESWNMESMLEEEQSGRWKERLFPYLPEPMDGRYVAALIRMEIEDAIIKATERMPEQPVPRIIEMPSKLEIHYEHTCSRCGCHVGAVPGTSADRKTWICAYCDHAQWSGRR